MKLAAFEIHASDPPALMKFYGGALGWSFTEDEFFGNKFWHIDGTPEGFSARLIQRHGDGPAKGAAVMGGVGSFAVEDIDIAGEKILAAGGTAALPKFHIEGDGWTAYYLDPDGNVFGIYQAEES